MQGTPVGLYSVLGGGGTTEEGGTTACSEFSWKTLALVGYFGVGGDDFAFFDLVYDV